MRSYPVLKDFGGGWDWKGLIFDVAVCGGISSLSASLISLFWSRISGTLSLHKKQNFFAFFIILCFCLSVIFAFVTRGVAWICALHQDAQDSFMDFYSMVAAYRRRQAGFWLYPPLSILLFHFLSRFVPDYVWADGGTLKMLGRSLRETIFGVQILFLFLGVFVLAFSLLLQKEARKKKLDAFLLVPCFFLSLPLLYALERGNVIIYAFLFTFLFLGGKDSERKIQRELSLVFLAVAANLKYYPAFFGLLLLLERRWKDAARCFAYGVLLFLLSWLCMGSFSVQNLAGAAQTTGRFLGSSPQMYLPKEAVQAVYGNGLNYSMGNFCRLFLQVARMVSGSLFLEKLWGRLHLTGLFTALAVLCALFSCVHCKKTWQKQFAIAAAFILAAARASSSYILVFLMPSLLEFLADEEKDTVSLALFCMIFVLFALPVALLPGSFYLVTFSFLLSAAAFVFLCLDVLIKAWIAFSSGCPFARHVSQFVKFGMVGFSNTAISYIVYALAVYAGAHYLAASVCGFVVSVFNSFLLNNCFVFKKTEGKRRNPFFALLKTYAAYSLTGLLLSNILLVLLVRKVGLSPFAAPFFVFAVTIPANFMLNKFWAFKLYENPLR